ncbi:MAG: SRPBCC family protein [Acidimicrobiales bacterium]|nr:SRPBCC family protein [Acidimicrobiales bacterium]
MNVVANRKGSAVVTLPTDTQIVITRQFDAPAALLFKAYTTPELVKRWWGYPEDGWEVCDIDLRVGGAWRWVTTHTNENGSFPVAFHGVYKEIDGPTRLVHTEVFEGAPGGDENGTLNTIVFSEVDGVTTMTQTSDCPEPWIRDAIIESGMEHGMQISMDRLENAAKELAA